MSEDFRSNLAVLTESKVMGYGDDGEVDRC